jgi:hypothetical protein
MHGCMDAWMHGCVDVYLITRIEEYDGMRENAEEWLYMSDE